MPTDATVRPADTSPLLAALKRHWGYESFRPLQREAIDNVAAGQDSVVVLPTGGGKSLCYQVPAVCNGRLAVVVSPLISLMKDQVDALHACGVAAACVNSTLSVEQKKQVAQDVRAGRLRLLYVAPERLVTGKMLDFLASADVAFFAIDEAHCISQWGHDFRPEYRQLNLLKHRFPGVGVHAFTATATQRVRQDIADQLGLHDPEFLVGDFDRPNLVYRAVRRTQRTAQILEVLDRHQGESGIVYCISRKEVDEVAALLRDRKIKAVPYHAGLNAETRHRNQEAFLTDRAQVVVATVAFGMGIDKSNVRFVAHSGMPKSLEHYQQEAGRAGRDGLEAECILLYSGSDIAMWKKLQSDLPAAARAAADANIEQMAAYGTGVVCRHKSLVEHFGQSFRPGPCGGCDVCLGEIDTLPESLTVAQKIVSCVYRLDQRFGAEYTALVLTGNGDGRISDAGHDKLSTFGLLASESKSAVREWIDQLLGQGYLDKAGEYNTLVITPAGRNLLKGDAAPKLLKPTPPKSRRDRRAAAANDDGWDGVDKGLFEVLRSLRAELAGERKVPPYVIFGDRTLRDLARHRPNSTPGLLNIYGVGQAKAETFGSAFLAAIAAYTAEQGLPTVATPTTKRASRRDEDAPGPSEPARKWFDSFRAGTSLEEVTRRSGMAASTVRGYLLQFLVAEGITDPAPWVDVPTAERVRDAVALLGSTLLRPIYEHLGGEVSYDDIRIALQCLQNVGELPVAANEPPESSGESSEIA